MSDEVPDWAKVWLDEDVATFLHQEAKLHYNDNVGLALNTLIRAVMKMSKNPDDPWAFVTARARTRRQ